MVRRRHRLLGVVLLLPCLGWAATGLVFLTKPGYGAAYDALPIRTYPLGAPIAVTPDPAWRELRYVRTTLGLHLLVRTDDGWSQRDPPTRQPIAAPPAGAARRLMPTRWWRTRRATARSSRSTTRSRPPPPARS